MAHNSRRQILHGVTNKTKMKPDDQTPINQDILGTGFVSSRRSATEGTIRQEVLRLAEQYVSKDRNAVHGKPEDNFAIIAKFQETYRKACHRIRGSDDVLPHDIAVDNILQKIARLVQSPYHRDHWIDIAGYAACGAECVPPTPPQGEIPENL